MLTLLFRKWIIDLSNFKYELQLRVESLSQPVVFLWVKIPFRNPFSIQTRCVLHVSQQNVKCQYVAGKAWTHLIEEFLLLLYLNATLVFIPQPVKE